MQLTWALERHLDARSKLLRSSEDHTTRQEPSGQMTNQLTEQYPSALPSKTFRAILLSGLLAPSPPNPTAGLDAAPEPSPYDPSRPKTDAVSDNAARRLFSRTIVRCLCSMLYALLLLA